MSQASVRMNQISDLLSNLGLFNGQYNTLRESVEGNDLLEKEKLVGSSAARIQEQMETCQVGMMSCSAIRFFCLFCVVVGMLSISGQLRTGTSTFVAAFYQI